MLGWKRRIAIPGVVIRHEFVNHHPCRQKPPFFQCFDHASLLHLKAN